MSDFASNLIIKIYCFEKNHDTLIISCINKKRMVYKFLLNGAWRSLASASALGAESRRFKSSRPDQINNTKKLSFLKKLSFFPSSPRIFMKLPKDYIIFPLDVPSVKEAKLYISLLSEHIGMFKIGLELFIRSGCETISVIKDSGDAGIFLDLKLHDIPATVLRAMKNIAEMDVTFTTVHCGESRKMLEAAVEGSRGKTGVLGVTVLTSISVEDIKDAGFKEELSSDMSKLVMKRANMAKAAGCAGVVCSGLEVQMIKKHLGKEFITVTPGIRPLWDEIRKDDQNRITTPAMAVKNGSDYLVIGKPVRDAKDPKDAAIRIADEIEKVLSD